jgi:hypothetical protein
MLITVSSRLPLAICLVLASCPAAAAAMIDDDDDKYDNIRVGTGHLHRWQWDKGGRCQYWCYS